FNAGKPILPVHLTHTTLSPNLTYFLSTRQWFDAGEAFDSGDTERVIQSLRQLLAGGARPLESGVSATSTTTTDRREWTRPVVLGGGVVLVLLAVVIVPILSRHDNTTPPRPHRAGGTVATAPR